MEDDKLTVKEVSDLLGVTAYTIRNYVKQHFLKATKVKKGLKYYYLFDKQDVEEFQKKIIIL